MRHTPFLCSPSHIRARANTALRELSDWKDVNARFTTDTIVRVLWLMATLKASLHHTAQRFVWPVGETTLRAGIAGQLPDPVTLAAAFQRRFVALLPRVPTKGFVVAIDTHGSCVYGRRGTRGTVHGQRNNGTRRYFVSATAVIAPSGVRYTLAVPAPESGRPMGARTPQLDQMAGAGIAVRKLLLDKGVFAAEVFHALDRRRINSIVAVPHRRRFKTAGDRTATHATVTIASREPGHRDGATRGPPPQESGRLVHPIGLRRPGRAIVGRPGRGGPPGVPNTVRDREQLPPTPAGQSTDDEPGSVVAVATDRDRVAVASALGTLGAGRVPNTPHRTRGGNGAGTPASAVGRRPGRRLGGTSPPPPQTQTRRLLSPINHGEKYGEGLLGLAIHETRVTPKRLTLG